MLHHLPCAIGAASLWFAYFFSGKGPISPLELDQLQKCPDIATLQTVLGTLCARYGSVKQINILPSAHAGKRQALCFLRMATEEEEQKLMSGLGIGRFGGELVVVVDMLAEQPLAGSGLWSPVA